jgi:hypothetical protein
MRLAASFGSTAKRALATIRRAHGFAVQYVGTAGNLNLPDSGRQCCGGHYGENNRSSGHGNN